MNSTTEIGARIAQALNITPASFDRVPRGHWLFGELSFDELGEAGMTPGAALRTEPASDVLDCWGHMLPGIAHALEDYPCIVVVHDGGASLFAHLNTSQLPSDRLERLQFGGE